MDVQRVTLWGASQRENAKRLIDQAPPGFVVRVSPPTRSLDQNAKLHAMLEDVARQVCWHGHWLTKEEWKDVLTAGLKRQKVVPGIEGGFVAIGSHTSKMSVAEMGDLITLVLAFGDRHGVVWTDPKEAAA